MNANERRHEATFVVSAVGLLGQDCSVASRDEAGEATLAASGGVLVEHTLGQGHVDALLSGAKHVGSVLTGFDCGFDGLLERLQL